MKLNPMLIMASILCAPIIQCANELTPIRESSALVFRSLTPYNPAQIVIHQKTNNASLFSNLSHSSSELSSHGPCWHIESKQLSKSSDPAPETTSPAIDPDNKFDVLLALINSPYVDLETFRHACKAAFPGSPLLTEENAPKVLREWLSEPDKENPRIFHSRVMPLTQNYLTKPFLHRNKTLGLPHNPHKDVIEMP